MNRFRAFLILLSLGGVAAILMIAGPLSHSQPEPKRIGQIECPNEMIPFTNAFQWVGTKNRVWLQAEHACGSKFGNFFDLSKVRLKIENASGLVAELESEDGVYQPSKNRLFIGKAKSRSAEAQIQDIDRLEVDLRSGEIRGPGVRFLINGI